MSRLIHWILTLLLSSLFFPSSSQAFSGYQEIVQKRLHWWNKPDCSSDTLNVYISYGSGQDINGVDDLYHNLISCPNVRSVSLSIAQGGCVIGADPWSFKWKKRYRFPNLENLTLSGYDWESREYTPRRGPRPLSAPAWKAAMDWSKLKRLDMDIPPPSFLEAFRGKLTGLESLVLRPEVGFWGDELTLCGYDRDTRQLRRNWTSFIAALPSLYQLEISGMGQTLDVTRILASHGATLKHLKVHEHERDCVLGTGNSSWTRPSFDVSQVKNIHTAAPDLETLTLDLWRGSNGWPYDILSELSNFSNLSHLTIYFNLEDPWHTRYAKDCYSDPFQELDQPGCHLPDLMKPLLNSTVAKAMFKSLRRDQPSGKVRRLTVYAGD